MSETLRYSFLSPQPLAKSVVLWLWLNLAANVVAAPVNVLSTLVAAGNPTASAQTDLPTDLLAFFVLVPEMIVYFVAAFLVLKWIYRTSRNAHAMARGLSIRPPWAVGWFFVPVAFLWKPYQSMKEVWQASTRPDAWRTVETPALLRWWWGLLLADNFIGQISFRISMKAETLQVASYSSLLDAVSNLLNVPLTLVLIRIVRELSRRQMIDMTFGDPAPPERPLDFAAEAV